MKHQTLLNDYLSLDVLNGRATEPHIIQSLFRTCSFLLCACRMLFVNAKVMLAITETDRFSESLINVWKTRAGIKMRMVICLFLKIEMPETSV